MPSNRTTPVAIVLALLGVASITGAVSVDDLLGPSKINPKGNPRVTIDGDISWNNFVQVMDGAHSAYAEVDPDDDSTKARIVISPLNLPLKKVAESKINFYAWYETGSAMPSGDFVVPAVDFVLDNGVWIGGDQNTIPVGATRADIVTEAALGYPDSRLWTQFQVQPCSDAVTIQCGFYSDFADADPRIPDDYDLAGTEHNLVDWAAVFPSAKIVQMRITLGGIDAPGDTDNLAVYIDNVNVGGKAINVDADSSGLATLT